MPVNSQQLTVNSDPIQSREAFRVRYRFGYGTTEQFLGLGEKGDRLADQLVTAQTKRAEAVRQLLQLTGYEVEENPAMALP